MITPVSPSESVNLLPGMRKNFNARSTFKKAIRAVGLMKKMNPSSPDTFGSGEKPHKEAAVPKGKHGRPTSTLSFSDVVDATVLKAKGLNLASTEEGDE